MSLFLSMSEVAGPLSITSIGRRPAHSGTDRANSGVRRHGPCGGPLEMDAPGDFGDFQGTFRDIRLGLSRLSRAT